MRNGHWNDGHWNDGMGYGNWGWIPMMIMMVAFWGGLIWFGITLLNRNHSPQRHMPETMTPAAPPSKPNAEEILAERLARGEIEPDDYRLRVAALRTPPST